MGKLTTFSRFLITLGIIGALYFAVTKFILPKYGSGESTQTETSSSESDIKDENSDTKASASSPVSASDEGNTFGGGSFGFTPTMPGSDAKKKGIVEMGATGFNSFIISVDKQKNWKLEKADYGASLVYEKLATDADIRAGLKTYIAAMLAYGVSPKEIHFVISSGAKKIDVTSKIIAELKSRDYVVNTVTAEQEGKYALKAAMPRDFEGRAFVVDIGSGNTKISWIKNGNVTALEASGAKYSQKGETDAAVFKDVKSKSTLIPSAMRTTCFIIGGVPYELAKQTRKGKERYTVLKSPNGYKADGDKQRCGLNIYKGVAEATDCEQFVFDWDANFSIGYLLSL